jgi:hypothetical protein
MGSEELIRKGFSIENDIQNMGQVERVRYAANLSYQLQEIPYEENHGQERWDAKHLVDRMWALSVDEMKISQGKDLDRRVAEISGCSSGTIDEAKVHKLVTVDLLGIYGAEILYEWRNQITITFFQYGKAVYGQAPRFEIVLRRKLLPAWLLSRARPFRGGLTREVTLENWVDTIIDTINVLKTHDNELSAICKASSHMDESGKTILKYPSWKTRGRILSIKKELPPVQVFHAKKEEQTYLDNAPGIHGSNGTYVENANPFWSLNIQIKRASFEVTDPIRTNIDVHEYITKSLMPKLGWGRITQDRLDLLNKILSGTVMELETSDTNETALYRKLLPIGYTSWDDYLDALIIPRIQQ